MSADGHISDRTSLGVLVLYCGNLDAMDDVIWGSVSFHKMPPDEQEYLAPSRNTLLSSDDTVSPHRLDASGHLSHLSTQRDMTDLPLDVR